MNKTGSTDTLEEVYLSNSSLLSESTNFSDGDALNVGNIPIEPTTTKRKSRLVTAFRSFRKKKIETKPSEEYPGQSETSDRKSTKVDKKGSRASRLVKRLSMSGLRRTKKSTDNLKRETPEGANLSVSEISLLEIKADETTATVETATNKAPRKGDQLQITISGKKIERRKDAIVNPISDTEIAQAEPSKPQRKSKKFNITVSDQDASPTVQAPPIPYSLCGSDISISSISTVEKISRTHSIEQSSISSTGVIKKSSFRKPNKRPLSMSTSTSKTGSLERGRRFPRPADDTKTDVAATGSVAVDNPSKPKPADIPTKIGPQPKPTTSSQSVSPIEDKPKIAFEVGTKVRPLSTPNLNRIETIESYSDRDEFSTLDGPKSSESSGESKSETARRRIAYVATPAIGVAEDEPADRFLSMEPLSHLSGMSEYNSLDSDFSLPPLFGDVIDDDDDGVGGILNDF